MIVSFISQFAGKNSIATEISNLLAKGPQAFHHVKFLVAYLNESGLALIKNNLEKYYDKGGVLEFIVSIDGGITTTSSLSYINKRFPDSSCYALHDSGGNCLFHSKVIIFEGNKNVTALIGSANITLGGLHSNCETITKIVFERKKDARLVAAVEDVWDTYRNPQPPITDDNLVSITEEILKTIGPKLKKQASKRKRSPELFENVPKVKFTVPSFVRKKITAKKSPKSKQAVSGSKLYLEVMKETGLGGTQVQIPTSALSFFGGVINRPIHIRVSVDKTKYRDAYINHFANNTHRINIKELIRVKRPAILEITKVDVNLRKFEMCIHKGRAVKKYLSKCTNRTRSGAKGWSIVP